MVVAIKLVLKEDTIFDVYYLDGVVKRYDILTLAKKYPQLNALKERELFLKGRLLGWSTVIWNDDLDIDVETPYYDGVDVTNEYDDVEDAIREYKEKRKGLIEEAELVNDGLKDLENGNIKNGPNVIKNLKNKQSL